MKKGSIPEWAKVGTVCRYNDSHSFVEILETMNKRHGAMVRFLDINDKRPFFLNYDYMTPYELPAWCKVGARVRRNHPHHMTKWNGSEGVIKEQGGQWGWHVEWTLPNGEKWTERYLRYFDMEKYSKP